MPTSGTATPPNGGTRAPPKTVCISGAVHVPQTRWRVRTRSPGVWFQPLELRSRSSQLRIYLSLIYIVSRRLLQRRIQLSIRIIRRHLHMNARMATITTMATSLPTGALRCRTHRQPPPTVSRMVITHQTRPLIMKTETSIR